MKTTIVVQDGRVTIQVDDGDAVEVKPGEVVVPIIGDVHTGPPHHESKSKPATAPKKPKTDNLPDTRTCEECGGPMTGRPAIAKICGSVECKKARAKKQNEAARRKAGKAVGVGRGRRGPKAQTDWGTEPDNPEPLWKDAPPAEPEFRSKCCDGKVELNGEDEPVCLACRNTCEVVEKPFDDPWDCGSCRANGRLCRLHHAMEAEGKVAPRIRHAV